MYLRRNTNEAVKEETDNLRSLLREAMEELGLMQYGIEENSIDHWCENKDQRWI